MYLTNTTMDRGQSLSQYWEKLKLVDGQYPLTQKYTCVQLECKKYCQRYLSYQTTILAPISHAASKIMLRHVTSGKLKVNPRIYEVETSTIKVWPSLIQVEREGRWFVSLVEHISTERLQMLCQTECCSSAIVVRISGLTWGSPVPQNVLVDSAAQACLLYTSRCV